MGGMDLDPLAGLGLDPAAENAPAGKNQGVRTVAIDDRQFEIQVKGRGGYGLPHWGIVVGRAAPALIWIMT